MPFIYKNKETEQYRLFGSIPIMCNAIGYDEKKQNSLSYKFSQKKSNSDRRRKTSNYKNPFRERREKQQEKKELKTSLKAGFFAFKIIYLNLL